jgi:hypothetical protein
MTRIFAATALLVLVLSGTPAAADHGGPTDTPAVGCIDRQEVNGSCPDWTTIYAGPGGSRQADRLMKMVMSPDGGRTFVTGASWNDADRAVDMTTVALDTDSGEVLWGVTRGGPHADNPTAIALSPDGSVVYVGGVQDQTLEGSLTVAYDATSGEELWASSHGEPGELSEVSAIAVHPDGTAVFVTGRSGKRSRVTDVLTLALNPDDGAQMWATTFAGPTEEDPGPFTSVVDLDAASDIALSPSGDQAYVSGWTYTGSNRSSYLLLAYDTTGEGAGDLRWASTEEWDGASANFARTVVVSPDGEQLYLVGEQGNTAKITGGVLCCTQSSSFGITAHDGASGSTLWRTTLDGAHGGLTVPQAAAIDPSGSTLVVAGRAVGPGFLLAQAQAMALDTATGAISWQATHAAPGAYFTSWADIAMDRSGERVFVTGHGLGANRASLDTVAYDTTTGAVGWQTSWTADPTTTPTAFATSVAVTPDGDGVIVAGGVARNEAAADRGDHAVLRYSVR